MNRQTTVPPEVLVLDDETSPGRALPVQASRARRRMYAGAALALAYATALLWVAASSADLGFLTYQGGPVVLVDPSSPAAAAGVQVGDVVVAIDGVAVDGLGDRQRRIEAVEPGARVTLTVARGDTIREVAYTVPRRVPIGSGAGAALGTVMLALAILADRGRRHELPQAFFRSTVVYVVFLAGAFSLDVAVRHPALLVPWLFAMTLAAPLTCRFMIRFPNGRKWFSRGELALLYAPPVVVATLFSVNHLAFELGAPIPGHGWIAKVLGAVAVTMATAYLAVGAVARARRLRAKRGEIDPVAVKWLHLGGAVMVVPLVASLWWASRDLPGFIAGGFRPFVAVAMVGGSACVVLAMSRVPFGDLDRLWRRSSGYVLATLLATAIYLGMIGLLGGAASVFSGGEFRIALAATLSAAVLFGPVRARLHAFVDERFARDRTRARRLLREASEAAVATLDIDELQRGVCERVRGALSAEGVALYVAVDDGWRCEVAAGAVAIDEIVSGGPVGKRLDAALTARAPRPVVGETIAVPLPLGDRRPAALIVAPRDGERLLDEDVELLSTAAANLTIALRNARAHRELREMAERLEREVTALYEEWAQYLRSMQDAGPTLEVVAVAPLVADVVAAAIAKSACTIDAQVGSALPDLRGDRLLLREALLNVVSNAAEACATTGGAVTVSVRAVPAGGAPAIEVTIADTGPGIARAELPRIFAPGYTTKETGSGVGLTIAERVVAAHHGRIVIESEEGRGTTVTVILPTDLGGFSTLGTLGPR